MQLKTQAEPWSHSLMTTFPLPHLEHLYLTLEGFLGLISCHTKCQQMSSQIPKNIYYLDVDFHQVWDSGYEVMQIYAKLL